MTSEPDLAQQLRVADLVVVGRFTQASNLTVLARTAAGVPCVYKPASGERPLWDYPAGTLGPREVATYELSHLLGWDLVPVTVLRPDGPFGPGVCQQFVAQSQEQPRVLVDVVPAEPAHLPAGWLLAAEGLGGQNQPVSLVHRDDPRLRRMALLDVIANNGDRKGGHILLEGPGTIRGIDHGLTFHTADKLRTVLWGYAGQPLRSREQSDLVTLQHRWSVLAALLETLLGDAEIAAARARLDGLLHSGVFPLPEPGWPRLPWPAL